MTSSEATVVMTGPEMAAAIDGLAEQIIAAHTDIDDLALLGILRRGVPLAQRIAERIESRCGKRPRVGTLSTALYRDDVRSGKTGVRVGAGETNFDFDVDGLSVVLVDDVLSTGRTIRAALDEVMDYGRPSRIQLACLIDRGLRELPIRADYLGRTLPTGPADHVAVRLNEIDGEDIVQLERRETPAQDGN